MNWREGIAKKWLGLKIAERASGLAAVRAAGRSTHRLVRKTQDGTLGKPDEKPMDDDETITVGDPQYHYHGQQQGQSNQLVTLALAAVLGGMGATWLPKLMNPEPKPAPPVATEDRVNQYELSIGTNEE